MFPSYVSTKVSTPLPPWHGLKSPLHLFMLHLCRTPGVPLTGAFISCISPERCSTCHLECPYQTFTVQILFILLETAQILPTPYNPFINSPKLNLSLLIPRLAMVLKSGYVSEMSGRLLKLPHGDNLWGVYILWITLSAYCVASSAPSPRNRSGNI